MPTATAITDASEKYRTLVALFPRQGLIPRAFALMGLAERVIAAAGPAARDAFKLLSPGELIDFSDELYSAHCAELVGRCVRKEDTRPGTLAEVAVLLHYGSLAAPLAASYACAYEDALLDMGMKLPFDEEQRSHYAWPGEREEIRSELRKKTSRADRV